MGSGSRHYEDMEQPTDPTTPQNAEVQDEIGTDQANGDQASTGSAHFETPPPPPPPSYAAPQPTQKYGRLFRTNGPISGVSGGIADYFNIDPVIVRLGMVAGTVIGGPTVPIAYIAAWIIIPEANSTPVPPIMTNQPAPPPPARHPDAPAPAAAPVSATAP